MRQVITICLLFCVHVSFSLPKGFIYVKDIAPDIEQDMRYASNENFVGRPIKGYLLGTCILTRQAANALKKAEKLAIEQGYHLKVYDCYRPQRAVNDFYQWSQSKHGEAIDPRYYPRVNKDQLFARGYIARYSGHSRGSTVDLTLIKNQDLPINKVPTVRCYAKNEAYLNDNSIDMGTRFDCLDKSAHFRYGNQTSKQAENKKRLRQIMSQAGFKPYHKEWWHFSLNSEPFPKRYFDFVVK